MSEQVDFVVKLRDAAALVLDACNEHLETLALLHPQKPEATIY